VLMRKQIFFSKCFNHRVYPIPRGGLCAAQRVPCACGREGAGILSVLLVESGGWC